MATKEESLKPIKKHCKVVEFVGDGYTRTNEFAWFAEKEGAMPVLCQRHRKHQDEAWVAVPLFIKSKAP